jgi:hypothetical protein
MLIAMVATLACSRAPQPAAPTGRAARPPVRMTAWIQRDRVAPLFPPSATHVQIVITPGVATGEYHGWVFADGSSLVEVYRLDAGDVRDLVRQVSELNKATLRASLTILPDGDSRIPVFLPPGGTPPPPPGAAAAATAPVACAVPRDCVIVSSPPKGGPPGDPPDVPWAIAWTMDRLQRLAVQHHISAPEANRIFGQE